MIKCCLSDNNKINYEQVGTGKRGRTGRAAGQDAPVQRVAASGDDQPTRRPPRPTQTEERTTQMPEKVPVCH